MPMSPPFGSRGANDERGSVAIEFLAASAGGLAITGATLLIFLAGLARIVETEAVMTATTRALYADAAPLDAQTLRGGIELRMQVFPIRLKLRDLSVADSARTASAFSGLVGAAASSPSGGRAAEVTATFAIPGFEAIGLAQEVKVSVGSELN